MSLVPLARLAELQRALAPVGPVEERGDGTEMQARVLAPVLARADRAMVQALAQVLVAQQ